MVCNYKAQILTIAGSDSSGGAGIQADIKTITMLGCYAASCVTSVTVQDTTKVYSMYNLPLKIIKDQVMVVLNDIVVNAIKIGMLASINIVKLVSSILSKDIPVIFDPVIVSTTGFNFIKEDMVAVFKKYIIPQSFIITPNIQEAEKLTGLSIKNVQDMEKAAQKILSYGSQAVLIKGSHLGESIIHNILLTTQKKVYFSHDRIAGDDFHGTGCTLSSAIAAFIGQNYDLDKAVSKAIKYVYNVIKNSSRIGRGYSPICHNYSLT